MKAFYRQVDDLEENKSLQNIFEIMGRFPENHAAEYMNGNGGLEFLDYRAYKERCMECAGVLAGKTAELPQGGFVGLQLKNCPEWGMLFWAVLMNGFCPVLIDAQAEEKQVAEILQNAGAVAVVTGDRCSCDILKIKAEEIYNGKPGSAFVPQWADKVVFCSSGTRKMKLCVYGGEQISNQIRAALEIPEHTADLMYPDSRGTIKNLALLPFHHIFGFVAVFLWYTFFGRTIVYADTMQLDAVLSLCKQAKVTHLFAVPMLFSSIANLVSQMAKKNNGIKKIAAYSAALEHGKWMPPRPRVGKFLQKQIKKRMFGDSIVYMISGGSYISPATLYFINALGYPLYNGYGMTEAGVTSVEMSPDTAQRERGSIGYPLLGVEYLLHPQRSTENTGELCIKSNYLYTGELKNGEFVPSDNGYFETGDYARLDMDGFYYIDGRIKEIIVNASGENISPDELESRFGALPGASRLCVLGVRHMDEVYERITMVLETQPDCDLSVLRASFDEANALLPLHKKVQDVFVTHEPLPVTATFKVKRQKLLKLLVMNPLQFKTLESGGVGADIVSLASVETKNQVREVFAAVLKRDGEEIPDNAHFVFDLQGDSFAYAGLIAQMEKRFAFEIPAEEYAKYATVLEFAVFIDSRSNDMDS